MREEEERMRHDARGKMDGGIFSLARGYCAPIFLDHLRPYLLDIEYYDVTLVRETQNKCRECRE